VRREAELESVARLGTAIGQYAGVVDERVDRAVQQACADASDEEWQQGEPAFLNRERLMCALDAQVRAIVDQLTPGNCDQYLTLPDAMRVGTVRRVPQPAVMPLALERAS